MEDKGFCMKFCIVLDLIVLLFWVLLFLDSGRTRRTSSCVLT